MKRTQTIVTFLIFLGGGLVFGHDLKAHRAITIAALDYLLASMQPDERAALESCKYAILNELLVGVDDEDSYEGKRFMFHFYPELSRTVPTAKLYFPTIVSDSVSAPNYFVQATCSSQQWANLPPGRTCSQNFNLSGVGNAIFESILGFDLTPLDPQTNDFTWDSAIQLGTMPNSQARRQGWLAMAHVVHLIQDLTSPAHVRDSPHPHPLPQIDAIESVLKLGDRDPLESSEESTNWIAPVRPPAGTISTCPIPQCFDEVQRWTQANFYSKNTVGKGIHDGEPRVGPDVVDGPDGGGYLYGLVQTKPGEFLSNTRRIARVTPGYYGSGLDKLSYATVDESVAAEQWQDLSAVAILYSARVIYTYWLAVNRTTPCTVTPDYDLRLDVIDPPLSLTVGGQDLVNVTAQVTNRGRQPVSLLRVGVFFQSSNTEPEEASSAYCTIRNLAPGDAKQCTVSGASADPMYYYPSNYTLLVRADDMKTIPVADRGSLKASYFGSSVLPSTDCMAFKATVSKHDVFGTLKTPPAFELGGLVEGFFYYYNTDADSYFKEIDFGQYTYKGFAAGAVRQFGQVVGLGRLGKNFRLNLRHSDTGDSYEFTTDLSDYDRSFSASFDFNLTGGDHALADTSFRHDPPALELFKEKTLTIRASSAGATEVVTADLNSLNKCAP